MSEHRLLYDMKPIQRPVWIVAFFMLSAFLFISVVLPPKPLAEFLRLMNVAFAAGVTVAYLPEALRRSIKSELDTSDYLLMGITIGWATQATLGTWLLFWRISGQPSWMVNSGIVNFLQFVNMMGSGLHIVAPGAIEGIPTRNYVRLGALVVISFGLSLGLLAYSSTVSHFVQSLRPFIEQRNHNYDSSQLHDERVRSGDPTDIPPMLRTAG